MYLNESNLKLGTRDGQVVARGASDGIERCFPISQVDSISIFGMAQLSTQLIRECISLRIPICYYSEDGHYFGGTMSFDRIDPLRQKWQVYLTDDNEFCVQWSHRVIRAKILNSITLLESHRDIYDFTDADLHELTHSGLSLTHADSLEMLLGFEGNAAKGYFRCLGKLIQNEDFIFDKRSARPPKDPFNSMLSFGYSLLYRNIIGAIERHGLHPYFAFMHKMQFGHAALASDLVEGYRAPLVDETVLDFVNSGDITPDDFYINDSGAVYMSKSISKALADRMSEAMAEGRRYFRAYGDMKAYGFQVSLDKMLDSVVQALESRDASLIKPFIWRR